jgi:hypothetical protein
MAIEIGQMDALGIAALACTYIVVATDAATRIVCDLRVVECAFCRLFGL